MALFQKVLPFQPNSRTSITAQEATYPQPLLQTASQSVQKEMVAIRDELGLTQYTFPWED